MAPSKQPTPKSLPSLPTIQTDLHPINTLCSTKVCLLGAFFYFQRQCRWHRWIQNRWAGLVPYIRFKYSKSRDLPITIVSCRKIYLRLNRFSLGHKISLQFAFCCDWYGQAIADIFYVHNGYVTGAWVIIWCQDMWSNPEEHRNRNYIYLMKLVI